MTQQEFTNRYQFSIKTDKIGGGSFGTVYKAYDDVLHIEVAIKVSEVKHVGNKEFSLLEEFKAIENISDHPNLANYKKVYRFESFPTVFDYGVMQYYPLGNLSHYLKNNSVSQEKRESLVLGILEGIAFLHKHKVVHRDLKPSNILVVERNNALTPIITDFGLSKQTDIDAKGSRLTNSFAGGTLQYSSPEQLKGLPLKLNTDLWSFGVIAYEILTNKPLFDFGSQTASAEAEQQLIQNILKGDYTQKLNSLPPKWQKIVLSCLDRDPKARIKNADEIKALYFGEKAQEQTSNQSQVETKIRHHKEHINQNLETKILVKKYSEDKNEIALKESSTNRKKSSKKVIFVLLGFLILGTIGGYYALKSYETQKENEAWKLAQTTNTKEAYQSFLETNKNLKYKALVQEKVSWLVAKDSNTIASYKNYKNQYPNTKQNILQDSIIKSVAWSKVLKDSSYIFYIKNIIQTKDKGYALTGSATPKNKDDATKSCLFFIKLNTFGDIVLKKTYKYKIKNEGDFILQTTDGGYIINGKISPKLEHLTFYSESIIIKLNSKGNKEWEQQFQKYNISRLIETKDMGFVLIGKKRYIWSSNKLSLFKLNSKGSKEWEKLIKTHGAYPSIDLFSENAKGEIKIFVSANNEKNKCYSINKKGELIKITDTPDLFGYTTIETKNKEGVLYFNFEYDYQDKKLTVNCYDSLYKKKWNKSHLYPSNKSPSFPEIIHTNDKGFFTAWYHYSKGRKQWILNFAKFNKKFEPVWEKLDIEQFKMGSAPYGVIQASDGGYIFVLGFPGGNWEEPNILLKVDRLGNFIKKST